MKRWGLVVTTFYLVIVVVCYSLALGQPTDLGGSTYLLIWGGLLAGGQALLLFLAVDTSQRRMPPRQKLWVSIVIAALFAGLLAHAAGFALLFGIYGEAWPDALVPGAIEWTWPTTLLGFWAAWGVVFYLYARGTPIAASRIAGWLIKGSVLELLIAVPSHVIVRRRADCTAPWFTGFGLATGLSIMLLSFGPSVYFLYRKRRSRYRR